MTSVLAFHYDTTLLHFQLMKWKIEKGKLLNGCPSYVFLKLIFNCVVADYFK